MLIKKIDQSKRGNALGSTQTMGMLRNAKAIVGVDKYFHYGLQRFQCTGKASTAACQDRDIMPQVGIDTFHSERVPAMAALTSLNA